MLVSKNDQQRLARYFSGQNPDNLSSVPAVHETEGKKSAPQVVL